MTLGTQVVLMRDGEIVQIGTPMELDNRLVNRFAATATASASTGGSPMRRSLI